MKKRIGIFLVAVFMLINQMPIQATEDTEGVVETEETNEESTTTDVEEKEEGTVVEDDTEATEPTEEKQEEVANEGVALKMPTRSLGFASFDGNDMNGATAVTYPTREAQMEAKTLTVDATFSGDANVTERKLVIRINEGLGLNSAPGMTGNSTLDSWTFNADNLAIQYQGVISNATWEPDAKLTDYANYQPRGGTLTYYFTPGTTQSKVSVSINLDTAFMVNNGSKTFTNVLTAETICNVSGIETLLNSEVLESYEITGKVYPIHYALGATSSQNIEAGQNVTVGYYVNNNGDGYSNSLWGSTLYKQITFNYKFDKKLGFQDVTYSGIAELSKDVTVTHTDDENYDYVTITLDSYIAKTSGKLFYFNFIITDQVAAGETYTINAQSYAITNYYGETVNTLTNHNTTLKVTSAFENKLQLSTIGTNAIAYQANTDNEMVLLGAYVVKNIYAREITNQKVEIKFTDASVGVLNARLVVSTIENVVVKTNLGREITNPVLSGVNNVEKSSFRIFDLDSNGRQENEYITEISYTAETFAVNMGVASSETSLGNYSSPTMFFGHFLEKPVDNIIDFTVDTAPIEDSDFTGPFASHLTGKMNVTEGTKTAFATSTSINKNLTYFAGDTYQMNNTVRLYRGNAGGDGNSYLKGFEIYLREGEYLQIDTSTLKITNGDKVYQVSDGTLIPIITDDNLGYKVIKLTLPELKLNADLPGITNHIARIEYDYKIRNTTPTTAINASELCYIRPIKDISVTSASSYAYYNNENKFDVDKSGDVDKYLGTPSRDATMNVQAQQDFNVTTAVNLNGGSWVSYDYVSGKEIINLNPEGDARYQITVGNSSGVDVPTGYTALVPIPKAGESTSLMPASSSDFDASIHLQKEAFTWTVALEEEIDLGSDYEVLYADSYEVDHTSANFKPYSAFSSDPSQIRMIKITKLSAIPDGFSESIDFPITLDTATADANAGNTNVYSARIYREIPGSSAGYKPSEPVAIRLKTGVIKGRVFNDTNRDGNLDGSETGRNGITVIAYKAGTTEVIETTTTSTIDGVVGSYEFLGLEKAENVDIVLVNPTIDDSLRYSNLTESADHSTTTAGAITPSGSGAYTVNAGLMEPYSVTLNAGSGSTANTTIKRYPGEQIDAQPAAQLTGHTFDGWFTAETGGTEWNLSTTTMIDEDVTLYARYTINEYTATFIKDGTTVGTVDVDYGTIFSVPSTIDTDKEGHTFDGWYTAQTGGSEWDFTTGTMPENGISLYARYTVNEYTATFIKDGTTVGTVDAD
ncbi:MAG: adhesive domain-containing protein, partial [Coprobacillaceae bacterium]